MQQLFPEAPADRSDDLSDDELAELYAADHRPPHPHRPWVLANMVVSLDGATAVDGVSGHLGGDGDRRVFRAIRSLPDVIMAGSGTVVAENYGAPTMTEELRAARVARGQAPIPELAVVSNSLGLDPGSRLFEADHRPIIVTSPTSPVDRRAELADVADVLMIEPAEPATTGVDLGAALTALHERGHRVVLVEGGPALNGQLVAEGLVDEWCVSIAADVVGGTSKRMVEGPALPADHSLTLRRVLEHDGTLFLRYTAR
ncbi:MAG: pyrimidine reductase family protein [Acidimicrobiales bacterium]|nr:pyrimidine reductase family protein [Acidimicrobiales bacterium]